MKFYSAILIFFLFSILANGQINPLPNFWSAKRVYIYEAIYYDSLGNILTKEKVKIQPTEKVWSDVDTNQTLINIVLEFKPEDSAKFAPFPLNNSPFHKKWIKDYQEGVIQNKYLLWMHPIRQNQYLLTELAPFPQIYFPIIKDTIYENTLYIYEGFGSYIGNVKSIYKIIGKEERQYHFGKLKCWRISAYGDHDILGKNYVEYYFNEEYGFTEMNYTFYNKQKINFKLKSLTK